MNLLFSVPSLWRRPQSIVAIDSGLRRSDEKKRMTFPNLSFRLSQRQIEESKELITRSLDFARDDNRGVGDNQSSSLRATATQSKGNKHRSWIATSGFALLAMTVFSIPSPAQADCGNAVRFDSATNAHVPVGGNTNTKSGGGKYQTTCTVGSSQHTDLNTVCVLTNTETGQSYCKYNTNTNNSSSSWSDCSNLNFQISNSVSADTLPDNSTSGYGYIVLTSHAWNGNLGGIEGANAKCQSDLQANNWKGKSDITDFSNARAFLCDSTTCNNFKSHTIYRWARAGDQNVGGYEFETGTPNSDFYLSHENFNHPSYRDQLLGSGSYQWWTNVKVKNNRNRNSTYVNPSPYSVDLTNANCNNWKSTNSSYKGFYGDTYYNSGGFSVIRTNFGCNGTRRLLCIVD